MTQGELLKQEIHLAAVPQGFLPKCCPSPPGSIPFPTRLGGSKECHCLQGSWEPVLCLVLCHGWDCLCACMVLLVCGGLCHRCTKPQVWRCKKDLLLPQGCLWPLQLIFTLMVSGCSPQGPVRFSPLGSGNLVSSHCVSSRCNPQANPGKHPFPQHPPFPWPPGRAGQHFHRPRQQLWGAWAGPADMEGPAGCRGCQVRMKVWGKEAFSGAP